MYMHKSEGMQHREEVSTDLSGKHKFCVTLLALYAVQHQYHHDCGILFIIIMMSVINH